METKLEQIAAKAVKQRPKSVVREIRTPRSVGTGGRRLPPVTRWFSKAGEDKGPSSDDNPHACGAAARKGPSPITRRAPSQINYSGISVGRGKKLTLVKT